jgi:hypothetical protein
MNIVYKTKRRKANWIGHSWRRNCLLKQFVKGKNTRARRQRRRCYQLLDDPKKERRYWTLKREAPDSNLW